MLLVQESVELSATPARLQIQLHLERGQATAHRRQRQMIHVAAFEQRPRGPMDPGTEGSILLAPPAAPAQGADDATEIEVSDAPMVVTTGYRALRPRC